VRVIGRDDIEQLVGGRGQLRLFTRGAEQPQLEHEPQQCGIDAVGSRRESLRLSQVVPGRVEVTGHQCPGTAPDRHRPGIQWQPEPTGRLGVHVQLGVHRAEVAAFGQRDQPQPARQQQAGRVTSALRERDHPVASLQPRLDVVRAGAGVTPCRQRLHLGGGIPERAGQHDALLGEPDPVGHRPPFGPRQREAGQYRRPQRVVHRRSQAGERLRQQRQLLVVLQRHLEPADAGAEHRPRQLPLPPCPPRVPGGVPQGVPPGGERTGQDLCLAQLDPDRQLLLRWRLQRPFVELDRLLVSHPSARLAGGGERPPRRGRACVLACGPPPMRCDLGGVGAAALQRFGDPAVQVTDRGRGLLRVQGFPDQRVREPEPCRVALKQAGSYRLTQLVQHRGARPRCQLREQVRLGLAGDRRRRDEVAARWAQVGQPPLEHLLDAGRDRQGGARAPAGVQLRHFPYEEGVAAATISDLRRQCRIRWPAEYPRYHRSDVVGLQAGQRQPFDPGRQRPQQVPHLRARLYRIVAGGCHQQHRQAG
jgi:hypothetical protein